MNVQAAYESKEHGKKGYLISGRVDGGMVKKGDKLVLKPIDLEVCIKVRTKIESLKLGTLCRGGQVRACDRWRHCRLDCDDLEGKGLDEHPLRSDFKQQKILRPSFG